MGDLKLILGKGATTGWRWTHNLIPKCSNLKIFSEIEVFWFLVSDISNNLVRCPQSFAMGTNICYLCEKDFEEEASLLRHLRDDEKLSTCEQCGKYFLYQNDLGTHMMNHTGVKPFRCSFCEKCFNQLRDQKRHEVVHNEEMPFSCLECKKQFKREQSLILHLKVHSGERPYKCDQCNKTFVRRTI